MNYPLVQVEWMDHAEGERGWRTVDELRDDKPLAMQSVGWIVHNEKDFLILAGAMTEQGLFASTQLIMRSLIRKITSPKKRKGK